MSSTAVCTLSMRLRRRSWPHRPREIEKIQKYIAINRSQLGLCLWHTQAADRRCFNVRITQNSVGSWKSIGKTRVEWMKSALMPKMFGFSEKIYKLAAFNRRWNKNKPHMWVSCLLACERRRCSFERLVYFLSEALWSKHIGNRAAETDGFSRREFVRKTFAFFCASEAGVYLLAFSHIFNPMMAYENKRFLWCFISHLRGFFSRWRKN